MTKYGEVKGITGEQWSRIYRYPVYSDIRLAEIALQKHIPSHMIIIGNRILLSYEGQPLTCYSCNDHGHQHHECPQKKTTVNNRIVTDKNTWAHVVTTGRVRRENTEEGKRGEGTTPNVGVENSEDDRCPIERGTDQQQHDDTATYKITASSLTCEENQYAEGESDRECDTGMVIDIQRGSMENLGLNDMEQDPVSKLSCKQDVDRDIEKLLRKRDKPNHINNDERTRKEDECGSDENTMMKPQTLSPKRNKKLKM